MIIRQLPKPLRESLTFKEFSGFASTLTVELERQDQLPIHTMAITALEECQGPQGVVQVDLLPRLAGELDRLRELRMAVGVALDATDGRQRSDPVSIVLGENEDKTIERSRRELDELNGAIKMLRELRPLVEQISTEIVMAAVPLRHAFDKARQELEPIALVTRCVGETSDLVPMLDASAAHRRPANVAPSTRRSLRRS